MIYHVEISVFNWDVIKITLHVISEKSKSISWKKHVWPKTLKSTKHKDSIKIFIEYEKQRFQNLQESIFLKKSFHNPYMDII